MLSGGWGRCVALSVYMAFPWCQLVIRSRPRSFKSWLCHRHGDREMADKTWAPVFRDVPLLLPVQLEL